ncbi:hypothetical protein [Paenibacillus cymbidii]|uniref:hypothetical protein n=1 Tax=Paenibacillus cymbidii TaxID=1639034 RepID=UPI0010812AE3|nr:hypothetical protein [Paenibacillus cymbidii]
MEINQHEGCRLVNAAWELKVNVVSNQLKVSWTERSTGTRMADDGYLYRFTIPSLHGYRVIDQLEHLVCRLLNEQTIEIRGKAAGLEIIHHFTMSCNQPVMEESIQLVNTTEETISLKHIEMGLQKTFTQDPGWHGKPDAVILPELRNQRLTALPFKHAADDLKGMDRSYTFMDLLARPGEEVRTAENLGCMYFPALHRASEGWAWEYELFTLGIFHFSSVHMMYSVIAVEAYPDRAALRFGGAAMVDGEPAILKRIGKGETVQLGLTRFEQVAGKYYETAYAFRAFLDHQGCRFPASFNPPIHWNELYDNPEWNMNCPTRDFQSKTTRSFTYTKAWIEQEAIKAAQYGAEALYLDPGWDTEFGSFLWGEAWLGSEQAFMDEMKDKYGLQVSLHAPVAPWTSQAGFVSSWSKEAYRKDRTGAILEGSLCLGSTSYLDEAAGRLLDHCAKGAGFIMFDGNNWNGGCWNETHGHPVPYEKNDHMEACMELTRRVKMKYPEVWIEMHDMISGGSRTRYTPVYYQYGMEHSYDMRWGYELMWNPLEDLLEGRSLALFYYNLACNVPLYLHIDLKQDNEHGIVFWWYASTCRHLGIGGTHRHPVIAESQKMWMKQYKRLKKFYTQGEFYGSATCPEEAHFHVLPHENALVINLFNLTTAFRDIKGEIDVAVLGLDPDLWYFVPQPNVAMIDGKLKWTRFLPPLGADLLEIWPSDSLGHPSSVQNS